MKNLRFGLAVFASALAMPTFSGAGNGLIVEANQTSEFVNFAGTGPAGIASDTLPGGQKFLSLTISNYRPIRSPGSGKYCVEVKTAPAGTAAMDTRIWMRKPNGTLVSLSDDAGTDMFARVMVFVECVFPSVPAIGNNSIELLIAANSKAHNIGNFHVVKTAGLTYDDCQSFNGPFVYVHQNGVQLFRTQ